VSACLDPEELFRVEALTLYRGAIRSELPGNLSKSFQCLSRRILGHYLKYAMADSFEILTCYYYQIHVSLDVIQLLQLEQRFKEPMDRPY
jgi:hypothetical protein